MAASRRSGLLPRAARSNKAAPLQLLLDGCFDGHVLPETACAVVFADLECDGWLVARPELTLAPQDHITSTEPERNQVNIRF
jgi:hypothetical protein